ncbi:MAG: magnesium transporter [Bdellovibrionaceae bacterium]|nr:magnesium transporter [Pseudobdellovibrionaceae bacterium]
MIDQPSPDEVDPFTAMVENWGAMAPLERKTAFEALARPEAVELFLSLKAHLQAELLLEAQPKEKRAWVRLLAPDDVADLIQEMGFEHRDEILDCLDNQTRREVTALLAYAEDNAGGLMSSRFIRLRPDMSVDEAISYLRIQAKTQVETIYYAYVIDADQTLLGVVSFRELFSAQAHKKIRDVMKTDLIKIPVGLDQEEVAKIFSANEFMAVPVVDEWGHIKGIVTFDDVAHVLQEEATEDMHKLAAVETLDAPYMKIGFFELVRKRAGWLIILFVGEMFTATAMGYFQHEIEKAVILALFIPLIISSGGNSGSQASTLIIRAMALGEVRIKDWWRVFARELGAGLCLGLILGLVGMMRILLWPTRSSLYGEHYVIVAITVACSVLGCVLWGTISGSMLPFVLRLCKLDPATASAPFVATLVDVTGLIIYFTVASLIMAGTLL